MHAATCTLSIPIPLPLSNTLHITGWPNKLWTGNGETGRMGRTSLCGQSTHSPFPVQSLLDRPVHLTGPAVDHQGPTFCILLVDLSRIPRNDGDVGVAPLAPLFAAVSCNDWFMTNDCQMRELQQRKQTSEASLLEGSGCGRANF